MQPPRAPWPAVLLLGPTGSGKSPLGDWLETHGLAGRRVHHFDFGANLRATAAAGVSGDFSESEIQFLREVLEEGLLLENESFYLARKILENFVRAHQVVRGDWLILNGLPRHVGQAEALAAFVQVRMVIQLECTAEVIRERLRRNTGGDRKGRTDDTDALLTRKLAAYEERTRPVAAYYRQHGAKIFPVSVAAETQASGIAALLGQP